MALNMKLLTLTQWLGNCCSKKQHQQWFWKWQKMKMLCFQLLSVRKDFDFIASHLEFMCFTIFLGATAMGHLLQAMRKEQSVSGLMIPSENVFFTCFLCIPGSTKLLWLNDANDSCCWLWGVKHGSEIIVEYCYTRVFSLSFRFTWLGLSREL